VQVHPDSRTDGHLDSRRSVCRFRSLSSGLG
jgi:hypothetical protein